MKQSIHTDSRLLLLTVAAGAADAMSLLRLKNVFASAMSANTVLLGLAAAKADAAQAERVGVALGAFVVGLFLAAMPIARYSKSRQWTPAVTVALAIEVAFLLAFLPFWYHAHGTPGRACLLTMLGLLSCAMGIQSAIAFHIHVPGVTTVYFTGTLTGIASGVSKDTLRPDAAPPAHRTAFQVVIYVVYFLSAMAMAFCLHLRFPPAPAIPAAAAALVLCLAMARRRAPREAAKR